MKETLSKFDETGRYLRFAVNENGQNILHVAVTSHPKIAEWLYQNRTDFSHSSSDNPNLQHVYKLANFTSCGDLNDFDTLGNREVIKWLIKEKGYQHHIQNIKAIALKYDDVAMSTFCDQYLFLDTTIAGDMILKGAN